MISLQKMDLLVTLYIFCIAVTELMGAKTFPILRLGTFTLNASVAIFVLPFIFTINDVITEVYGKARAQSVVRCGLFIILLILLFSVLATSLPPSTRFAKMEPAYDQIFLVSVRMSAASLIAFAIAEFTDVFIFVKLRERFGTGRLWLRNNLSNFLAQFFDTTIFLTLAFYALDKAFANNVAFLWSLILPYWLLKCAMSMIETPFVYAGVKWLKE